MNHEQHIVDFNEKAPLKQWKQWAEEHDEYPNYLEGRYS